MYYIYVDGINSFSNEFAQIGLSIRKLNKKEKTILINRYNEIYKNRYQIRKLIKSYKDDRHLYRKLSYESFNDEILIELILYKFRMEDKKPIFHKNIINLFDKLMIIKVDKIKLSKYIEHESFDIFVRQFFDMAYVYDEEDYKNTTNRHNNYLIRRYNLTSVDEMVLRYLYNDFEYSSKYILRGSNSLMTYCQVMDKFFKTLSSKDIFRFIEILEMYNIKYGYPMNFVINNILVIESLIIKEESPTICKDFILKGSLLLKDSNLRSKLDDYKIILNYIYSVRSDLVHGNNEKLLEDYSKLKSQLPNLNYPEIGKISKMKRKKIIVDFTYVISEKILNSILKMWFVNPYELSFIKNC